MTNKKKLNDKPRKIAVVGAGVVGLATGKGLLSKDFDVVFIDINQKLVEKLRQEGLKSIMPGELDPSDVDIFFVAVPSYTQGSGDGLSEIRASAENLGRWIAQKSNHSLIVIRSTILPGTSEQVIIPAIERYSGKKAGIDFDVCVNPEYLREKTSGSDFENPWLVVIGADNKASADILESVYYWVSCPIIKVTIAEAELQKFLHNICNANKISFFNEMRMVCDKLGIDSERIFPLVAKSAESIWNPVYGIRNFGAFGGKCLPKDSHAFLRFSKDKLNIDLKMLKAILGVNSEIETKVKAEAS